MSRLRKRHELKCWPEFFEPTLRGIKRFELRRDDRGGFQVGDELLLKEWKPDQGQLQNAPGVPGYTGREVLVQVDYVIDTLQLAKLDPDLAFIDYAIMSVSRVE